VGESILDIRDLTLATHVTQLPAHLSTLREASSTQRVTLRGEATRRVHDPLTTIRHVAIVNELA